jgi:glyoxylase-like metal-dependent hydrolase (beta-lactamase superfamily II)
LAIPYVRDFEFEYGVVDQVSPLIRRVICNNPGPFTFKGTGTYIVGQGEVCVIDPGPDDAAHLEAILAATAGERIVAIAVTHNHADHSPLATPLQKLTGAVTYGCPLAHPPGASEVKMDDEHDSQFVADVSVCEGGVIAGTGWTLRAIPTPGHTSNHICFALLEENALFSGDHIMGWSTTVIVPPDGQMGDYYASLDRIAERGFATLWPTHGPPITEPAPFIAAYKAHRLDRERQILEQLAAGHGQILQMVPIMYAAVDPRLYPAAAQSVLAHLIHLTRSGDVACSDAEPGLRSSYSLP